jgi:hypothetical protein
LNGPPRSIFSATQACIAAAAQRRAAPRAASSLGIHLIGLQDRKRSAWPRRWQHRRQRRVPALREDAVHGVSPNSDFPALDW